MPRVRSKKSSTERRPYAIVKSARGAENGGSKDVYAYDMSRFLMVVLKQLSPDWDAIASAIKGKTRTKAYDTWRQIICPALVSGKPWSTSSSAAWSTEDRIELVVMVVQSGKIDWSLVCQTFPGRTKAQLYDVWRQGILPKLKKGEAVR